MIALPGGRATGARAFHETEPLGHARLLFIASLLETLELQFLGLHLVGGEVHTLLVQDRLVANHRVEKPQVALQLQDEILVAGIAQQHEDAAAIAVHRIGEPAPSPIVDAEQAPTEALDDLLDPNDQLLCLVRIHVRAHDVDGLVLTRPALLGRDGLDCC